MKIKISSFLPLFLLSLIISRGWELVFSSLAAVFIHEVGHLLVAKFSNIKIKSITLNIYGAHIDADLLGCSYKQEILLCLAGPFANIFFAMLIFLLSRHFNTNLFDFFILSSLFLAALNLIPANGFDGGRVLNGILCEKLKHNTHYRIMNIISFLCFFILWTISIYVILKTGSYLSLFVFSLSLFVKLFIIEA